jgi:hypothetical protein
VCGVFYAVLKGVVVVQGVANKGEAEKCRDLAKVSQCSKRLCMSV